MARLSDRPQPGSQPPPGSPFLPPPPRPQLPPADPRLRQRALAGLTLALLSLLAIFFGGSVQRGAVVAVVALVVAAAGLVLAVSAMRAAKRAGARRPGGALAGAVLGVLAIAASGVVLLGFVIFGRQLDQYANCMNGANTVAEQQACHTQLVNSIDAKIGIRSGS